MRKYSINPKIVKSYDIRGIVGAELNDTDAYFIGLGFGYIVMQDFGKKDIYIASDARQSGVSLKQSLINGLIDSGQNVIDIGIGASPYLYFASLKSGFGIIVTASHNPGTYNGFKIVYNNLPFFGPLLERLQLVVEMGIAPFQSNGCLIKKDFEDDYLSYTISKINTEGFGIKIGFDALNGAAGRIIEKAIPMLGVEAYAINCKMSGVFSSVGPDPTKEQNLIDIKNLIKQKDLDIGFAIDGDGDRMVVIDKSLNIVEVDNILAIFAKDILQNNKGKKMLFDVKCSDILKQEVTKYGGEYMMYKTGHSFIKQKMDEDKSIIFAGEASGHIYFKDSHFGFDDAVYSCFRLIKILCNARCAIESLVQTIPQSYKSPEIKIKVKEKELIIKSIKEYLILNNAIFNDIDGVRVVVKDGWFLIRQSNTEDCIIIRYEAFTTEAFDVAKQTVDDIINKFVTRFSS